MRGLCALLLLSCSGPQHALRPQGPAAAEIASLWWWTLALTGIPAAATLIALLVITWIRRKPRLEAVNLGHHPKERRVILGLGLGITPVLLSLILIGSLLTGVRLVRMERGEALIVEVIGHQYWWEVRYPELDLVDANELHLPAGVPVLLRLRSADVIHSFWIPRLHGKLDMIPGRELALWIQADTPGWYRGQCAEFCGLQHALMALVVHAHPPDDFARWARARRRDAGFAAQGIHHEAGRAAWHDAGCDQCHQIRGLPGPTVISGTGPDLTFIGSRQTLGAGTLPNNRGNLSGWILDPHAHKPGVRMPPTRLSPDELEALVGLLEALK